MYQCEAFSEMLIFRKCESWASILSLSKIELWLYEVWKRFVYILHQMLAVFILKYYTKIMPIKCILFMDVSKPIQ